MFSCVAFAAHPFSGPAKADLSVLARGRGPATELQNDRGETKDSLQRREALEQALHERAQPQRGPLPQARRCAAARGFCLNLVLIMRAVVVGALD